MPGTHQLHEGNNTMQQYAARRTSSEAIWSLVLGIVGTLSLGPIAGIPAIILGHIARANIRKSNGQLDGDTMAVIGLILGYISAIGAVIALMLFFMLMGLGIFAAAMAPQVPAPPPAPMPGYEMLMFLLCR